MPAYMNSVHIKMGKCKLLVFYVIFDARLRMDGHPKYYACIVLFNHVISTISLV